VPELSLQQKPNSTQIRIRCSRNAMVVCVVTEQGQRIFPPKPYLPIGQRGPLSPDHLAPHPLSLKLGSTQPGPEGGEGEARATCQSMSDCSPIPKTTDDCLTVARPSDGPTDPSRRSRGADPAFEREIDKIIKDDRRGRFSPPHLRACESTAAPARAYQTGAGPPKPNLQPPRGGGW